MPIFEYLCSRCGETFEKLVLGSQAAVECPRCPGAPVEKLFSAFAVKSDAGFTSSAAGGCGGCAPSG